MENIKKISHKDIAEYFLAFGNESGEVITNLKLQKLVYYAQAWYLANNKESLFDSDFQAWVHGPVIPSLYREYKHWGSSPICNELKFESVKQNFDAETLSFLEVVTKAYMPFGAYQLELMTHQEEPWIQARQGCDPDEKCETVISRDLMTEFYGKKIQS